VGSDSYLIDFHDYLPITFDATRYVGSCHHGMACPWVVGGGDGLQVWRAAANILNK